MEELTPGKCRYMAPKSNKLVLPKFTVLTLGSWIWPQFRHLQVEVAGYAWSGGGKEILRVELSTDGGQTWSRAEVGHLGIGEGSQCPGICR